MQVTEITLIIAVVIESIAIIFLAVKIFSLSKYLKDLFGKNEGKNIEKVLNDYVKNVKKYYDDIEELKDFSHQLYKMTEKGIQKIGFVRFNPFDDVGGNQSFSIALLDYKNNGITITSLFGREGTRIYSKQIIGGKSSHHLAEEEQKAIEDAQKNYKKGE